MVEHGKGYEGALPDPLRVAERYAEVTGQENAAPSTYASSFDLEAMYSIHGISLDQAGVFLRWGGNTIMSPIGQYNPATGDWVFAPEYVDREDHPPLASFFRDMLEPLARKQLASGRILGRPEVDMYASFTRTVRSEMMERLRPAKPNELLARPKTQNSRAATAFVEGQPAKLIEVDDYAICFPTLGSTTPTVARTQEEVGLHDTITAEYKVINPEQLLILCFTGVKVARAERPGATLRSHSLLVVATRSQEDPSVWVPDEEVITPAEWDVLQSVPAALHAARRRNPHFSPLFGAVTYNNPLSGSALDLN